MRFCDSNPSADEIHLHHQPIFAQFVDTKKKGTLILSMPRSGNHYLCDIIDCVLWNVATPIKSVNYGEIHNTAQFNKIMMEEDYTLAIINNYECLQFLGNNLDLLTNFHVIQLTRNNVLEHLISKIVFFDLSSKHPHHNSVIDKTSIEKEDYTKTQIEVWLGHKKLLETISYNVAIDYSELKDVDCFNFEWIPNTYNLSLHDLLTNADDVIDWINNYE